MSATLIDEMRSQVVRLALRVSLQSFRKSHSQVQETEAIEALVHTSHRDYTWLFWVYKPLV